jgi:AcrR family transcriptional regulator
VPRKIDHGERRGQIAAAALRVVAAEGLRGTSLRHVASEAGVTSGMVQHYFPSKDAMIEYAMETARVGFERRITAALDELPQPSRSRDVVRAVLAAMLPLGEDGMADGRIALEFLAYATLRPPVIEQLATDSRPLREFLAAQVRATRVPEDAIRLPDASIVALALLAVAEGLSAHVLSHQVSAPAALAALDAQLDLVFGSDADADRQGMT